MYEPELTPEATYKPTDDHASKPAPEPKDKATYEG
jgi:hypothetical protein